MRGPGRQLLIPLLLVCLSACSTQQVEPVREGQGTFIRRAIFAGGTLWLLSDAGQLFTVADGGRNSAAIASRHPVLDLWRQNGVAVAAACADAGCRAWALLRWDGKDFVQDALLATRGEHLLAAGATDDATFFLTAKRLVTLRDGKATERNLTASLESGPVSAVLFTQQGVYVGINAGEWGGGLQFIDLASGSVRRIEKNVSKDLCGGPLNTNCDPVTGLAVLPWKPDCIGVAIGLVHFSPHGRVVEVCGSDVTRLYFKPFGEQPERDTLDNGEPFSTVAFFGLQSGRQGLWAVGIDGIYRIEKGAAQSRALPAFQKAGEFSLSFADPDVVLVLTDINQRLSLSGSVPLLVPR